MAFSYTRRDAPNGAASLDVRKRMRTCDTATMMSVKTEKTAASASMAGGSIYWTDPIPVLGVRPRLAALCAPVV